MSLNLSVLVGLLVLCALLLVVERLGIRTTLQLSLRGDVKRETRFLAQYGQAACTALVAILIWQIDTAHRAKVVPLLAAVIGTSVLCMLLKRLLGRVRPGREQAGRFLGPALSHANHRESFPSSHSASAAALSVVLAAIYPQAAATFWTLAVICAMLRYLMDAHWPSDVLGGIAIGYIVAHVTWSMVGV